MHCGTCLLHENILSNAIMQGRAVQKASQRNAYTPHFPPRPSDWLGSPLLAEPPICGLDWHSLANVKLEHYFIAKPAGMAGKDLHQCLMQRHQQCDYHIMILHEEYIAASSSLARKQYTSTASGGKEMFNYFQDICYLLLRIRLPAIDPLRMAPEDRCGSSQLYFHSLRQV